MKEIIFKNDMMVSKLCAISQGAKLLLNEKRDCFEIVTLDKKRVIGRYDNSLKKEIYQYF